MKRFDDLVRGHQLMPEHTSKEKIQESLGFAAKEIEAAEYLLPKFRAEAYKAAYDALLHAGNALIRSYGYRPTHKSTHATLTEITERIMGKGDGHLVGRFKRMRRKRHQLQYDAIFIESADEVKKSIGEAKELVEKITAHINERSQEPPLF
jgi:uncharacterized protein (UPF0332 family)